ncbi:MAG TPA: 50S ribosomal protein L6 [Vicinamibacteria bacterium]|nr:50S ribosomal protein L6 [Vicinamibacteria bacterium]
MSRVGGKPIPIPKGVKVTVSGSQVAVEGPKGKLVTSLPDGIEVSQEDGHLKAAPREKADTSKPFWGLARSLVANAVHGVHEGFSKELDIVGIGYRAQVVGRKVEFALGYSHPIHFAIPDGIEIKVDKNTHIVVSGADKQLVGQTAANIRALRKPDPYKQKGIRYTGEHLKRKAGKTGVG